MRIATYNVEWFSNLFDDTGAMFDDDAWSGRWDVTRAAQLAALGAVFQALNADAVMVIEAPDGHARRDAVKALEGFAARFGLRARRAVLGYANQTQQEIMLLYDPDVMDAAHDPHPGTLAAPRFDGVFAMDVDVDAMPDPIRWSKPPLEAAVTLKNGRKLRLIGVHAKSKAPHGARDDAGAMRIGIENRRKQLAQCVWLRARVDQHLSAGDALIVLGDFNDGPGLDEYEKLFGRSGIEIVMGEGAQTRMTDPHAQLILNRRIGAMPATARFKLRGGRRYLSALLDYIMVSLDLAAITPEWHIWHPFDDPAIYADKPLRDALLAASDHFPVTIDIDL